MNRLSVISAVAACLMAAPARPVPADAPYTLPVGTRAEYVTTVTLPAGPTGKERTLRVLSAFTVLREGASGRTVFCAANIEADGEESTAPVGRFTFEISETGEVSDRAVGFRMNQGVPWNPQTVFPRIPSEAASTVTVNIPLGLPAIEAGATRAAAGDMTSVKLTSTATPEDWEQMGARLVKYEADILYAPATKLLAKSSVGLTIAAGSGGEGGPTTISLSMNTQLARTAVLPQEQIAKLGPDVLAGIGVFEALSGEGEATSEPLALVDEYLASHPDGQFADLMTMVKRQAEIQEKMMSRSLKVKQGDEAPGFEAKGIDGKTVKLADYKGKVVLLDFWATWCGPCKVEVPAVKEMYEKLQPKGLEIIGISGDRDKEALESFVKERGLKWPQIFDADLEDSSVLKLYGVTAFPTTLLLDRKGVVRTLNARGEKLAAEAEKLVAEK